PQPVRQRGMVPGGGPARAVRRRVPAQPRTAPVPRAPRRSGARGDRATGVPGPVALAARGALVARRRRGSVPRPAPCARRAPTAVRGVPRGRGGLGAGAVAAVPRAPVGRPGASARPRRRPDGRRALVLGLQRRNGLPRPRGPRPPGPRAPAAAMAERVARPLPRPPAARPLPAGAGRGRRPVPRVDPADRRLQQGIPVYAGPEGLAGPVARARRALPAERRARLFADPAPSLLVLHPGDEPA